MHTVIGFIYDQFMETRLLEYFVAVADELNVTRAAARLYAAQSTVSAGLRSLESELGVTLFERSTKAVRLLPAGEELLPLARRVLDEVTVLREAAPESVAGFRGRVRIGTFAALQLLDLPGLLGRFRRRHPRVDLQLTVSPTGSTGLADDLVHGRLDLALTALPPSPAFDSWPLVSYPFVALLPRSHPLAGASSVSLAQLADDDWVDMQTGFGNRVAVERAFAELGIVRHIAAELAELPAVGPCVAAGLGVAVVPDLVVSDGCVRVPLTEPIGPWVVSLATRRGQSRRPVVAALVDEVRASMSAENG